ncbi:hypothetical protein [Modestobacter sp. NPDC013298]|uniref:hypothetical protein n=1 Tax=Modestobacter sp. NPDC013298 TaxID=3155464 RepID=UPI0033F8F159
MRETLRGFLPRLPNRQVASDLALQLLLHTTQSALALIKHSRSYFFQDERCIGDVTVQALEDHHFRACPHTLVGEIGAQRRFGVLNIDGVHDR